MTFQRTALTVAFAAAAALLAGEAAAASDKRIPLPRPRPAAAPKSVTVSTPPAPTAPAPAPARAQASINPFAFIKPAVASASTLFMPAETARPAPAAAPPTRTAALPPAPLAAAPTAATPPAEVETVKRAIELARRDSGSQATALAGALSDPLARKLIEWVILRSDDNGAGFTRYAAFVAANPSWPSVGMLRRRAEGGLWDEKRDTATVQAFFAHARPTTAKGRFALARALLAQGDRAGAAALAREAWRLENFGGELEKQVLESFPDTITRADHKARMDRRLYAEDGEAALRAAHRLGGHEIAIAKARDAVNDKAGNAGKLLDAVPAEARRDAGYIFSRIQWLRRQDRIAEAAQLMLAAPRDPAQLHNLDEWWIERRLIARKLLDDNKALAAYHVARDAASPPKELLRGEHEFTAGWIALRFLKNPSAALPHFSRVGHATAHPTTLARSAYWQGRAHEAAGRHAEARAQYEAAAKFPTAYYGQIARAKLGHGEMALRPPPEIDRAHRAQLSNLEAVRAVELLYAADQRDLVVSFVTDLAERTMDIGALVVLAEVAAKYDDARAMLYLGKAALGRGFAFDHIAFPSIGIPNFTPIGPPVDRSVVYAIVRQESAFNPRAVSSAKALGLMQVMPGTGRLVAKKFGVAFDQNRMLTDAAYNAQLGAAELADVLAAYRGSYILTFVAYNAGRGRAREWIERFGDPRDPQVDPIDWVERIPFAETRNYVQRVMENVQVYRVRLGQGSRLMIEADLRRGAVAN